MKITMLGTGHGTVIKCYNTCFTINNGEEYFLVDAGGGNGVINQLEASNINVLQIKNMFISHTHTDHIMGAIWVIRMIARKFVKDNLNTELCIYGNDKVIHAIRTISNEVLPQRFLNLFDNRIKFIEVDTGDSANILGKKVEFFDTNANKVKLTGFIMWLNNEEKLTFIGDEYCKPETEKYVENSKWLIADSYMAGKEAEEYNPIEKHSHSTVKFVAELCERLKVKNVILSHTVDTDLTNRKQIFTEDAKKYYSGNVYMPDDLETLVL